MSLTTKYPRQPPRRKVYLSVQETVEDSAMVAVRVWPLEEAGLQLLVLVLGSSSLRQWLRMTLVLLVLISQASSVKPVAAMVALNQGTLTVIGDNKAATLQMVHHSSHNSVWEASARRLILLRLLSPLVIVLEVL